eukprot:TRINITY_DN64325_c0_g1_i1.p1 TRINITY_DN64325_c0_g1~~TRINITY_DN64325_c0_g1_i1.p1  ORF type:complete len:198 (-),score=51.66 TRINITY_DN64325_c0_g1_i1:220-813(-)
MAATSYLRRVNEGDAVPDEAASAQDASPSRGHRSSSPKKPVNGRKLRDIVLQQSFRLADQDSNGFVSKAELKALIQRVMPSIKPELFNELWAHADTHKQGRITFPEFKCWLEHEANSEVESLLTAVTGTPGGGLVTIFRTWDTDGSGVISVKELQAVCENAGMPAKEMRVMLDAMDANHDGEISYHEFAQFLFGELH